MTAPGEDILAWLDGAITRREETARATGWETIDTGDYLWDTKYLVLRRRDESLVTTELDPHLAEHVALNDPADVLRRCAADRKLLELHARRMHSCPAADERGYLDEWTQFDHSEVCPVVQHLADGYGWTEGER